MKGYVECCVRLTILLAVAAVLNAASPESRSAQRKFDAIERGVAPPGATVVFSPVELNAWAREEAEYWAADGVRNLRLDFSETRATGVAQIDFLKLKQRAGDRPGYLMSQLLAGERPVSLTARFESRNGRARVTVERLEISGIPLEGVALDFLMSTYVQVLFPDARVGEWFSLDRHVDSFGVHARGVDVRIRDPHAQIAFNRLTLK